MNKRGYILIEGDDRYVFLNGLMTNDAHRLSSGDSLFTAFLNAQGRFLFDCFLAEKEERILLDIHQDSRDQLFNHLAKYKLRSKVGLTKLEDPLFDFSWPEPFAKHLTKKDRILKGIPFGDIDVIPEKGFILECGYDDLCAIDWKKGCYLGQELVAKTKYRGELRKRLMTITFDGDLTSGSLIVNENGQEAGEIRSIDTGCGLAMIRLEFVTQPLFVGATSILIFPSN